MLVMYKYVGHGKG